MTKLTTRRRSRAGLGVAVVALALTTFTVVATRPAHADSRSASCTEAGVTWRVDYNYEATGVGGIITITGLQRNGADASTMTWELRRDNWPDEWPPARNALAVKPFGPYPASGAWPVRGGLSVVGAEAQHELTSPRLVTPDGECQIYLTPFLNLGVPATAPKVGVLGDSLLQSLNDSDYNRNEQQGYVEGVLNSAGILVEVEGQGGRSWGPAKNTTGLAKADSYLLDEFRGLLEYDPAGFVAALGANDAFSVQFGVQTQTQATDKVVAVAREFIARTRCLVAITAPEHYRLADGTFPEPYHQAAIAVNNIWRYVAAVDPVTELIDFAAQAETHPFGSASPWFVDDNVHLNTAGKLVYTSLIAQGAQRCTDSAVLYGKAGTFTGGPLAGRANLPTGQALRTQAVAGWDFEPGKAAYWSTVTADNTVMIGNQGQTGVITPTGNSMVISAFQPDAGTFTNIRLRTDRGQQTMARPDGTPVGFDIGDVGTIDNATAVVFTGSSPYRGQDLETYGMFPVFGVVTKGPNGWAVAEGPGWRNSWSPRDIVAQATDQALANRLCPVVATDPAGRAVRECRGITELAVLPQSRDIVIAQYFGPSRSGQVAVLSLDGPDAAGRYTLQVAAVYTLPDVVDPNDATKKLTVAPREVETDPTSALGDERFGLASDVYGGMGGLIEFTYNAGEPDPTRRIRPVSGPIMTGEVRTDGRLAGLSPFHYDRQGNLWTQPGDGFESRGAVVYAKTGGGRKVTTAACGFDPQKPLASYVLRKGTAPAAWGVECRPDYEILQADAVGAIWNFDEDPVTHDIVAPVWPGGLVYVITPSGSGESMTFRVSNVVNPLAQSIQAETRACPTPTEPNRTCSRRYEALSVVVDYKRRGWIPVTQLQPGWPGTTSMDKLDQWVYGVDLTKLQGRELPALSARTNGSTLVPAELKQTQTTVQRTGQRSDVDVDADAPVAKCGGCVDPVSGLTGGFMLADENGAGVPTGAFAEYQVIVPKTGSYRLDYQARKASGSPVIALKVDGTAGPSTPVTGTAMGPYGGIVLNLTAGVHTLRLEAGSGGWQLDWLRLTRT